RNQVDGFPEKILVQNRSGKSVRFLQLSSLTEQYMIFHVFKRCFGSSIKILPRMMKIKRRTMIDEPKFTIPKKQIGIFKSTVDIRNKRIQPHDFGSQQRIDRKSTRLNSSHVK